MDTIPDKDEVGRSNRLGPTSKTLNNSGGIDANSADSAHIDTGAKSGETYRTSAAIVVVSIVAVPPHIRRRIEIRGDCWIWTGAKNGDYGYLQEYHGGKKHRAHRYLYEKLVGPVPHGLHLDHLCRTPACVNPAHLEPVTAATNIRRGAAAKLNAERALEIRALHVRGISYTKIAAFAGTSKRSHTPKKRRPPAAPDAALRSAVAAASRRGRGNV